MKTRQRQFTVGSQSRIPKPPLGPRQVRTDEEVKRDLQETPRQDMAPLLAELASLRLTEAARAAMVAFSSLETAAEATAQAMAAASYQHRLMLWHAARPKSRRRPRRR